MRHTGAAAGKFRQIGRKAGNTLCIYNQSNAEVYFADGGTAWIANSDERLKTNIKAQPSVKGLAAIIKIDLFLLTENMRIRINLSAVNLVLLRRKFKKYFLN